MTVSQCRILKIDPVQNTGSFGNNYNQKELWFLMVRDAGVGVNI